MRAAIHKNATNIVPGKLPVKIPAVPTRTNPARMSAWEKTSPIQASLKINIPSDHYEKEADHVAGQIMRMSEPQVQRKTCVCGRPAGPDGMCKDCKREQLGIQRMANGEGSQTAAPPIVHQALQQSGRPLDSATQNFMESRFGRPFSHVRTHSDTQAANSAKQINANAYTTGNHIVFGPGQYVPQSWSGKRLIAHELAHVLQQQIGASEGQIQRQEETGSSSGSPTVYICAKDLDTSPVGRHAFFRIGGSGTGNPTISLQPIDVSLGAGCWQGIPDRDYPSDFHATADCDPTPVTLECLEREFSAYPIGHYCTWGPNSNTFVGHVARACGVSSPNPSGWTPGIDVSPPPSGTFAPDKWDTLTGCVTKECIIPGINDTDRAVV